MHGGPRENISPRFNSHFTTLASWGYGILAINYPGSSGRGRSFESLWANDQVKQDALRAAFNYLFENGIRNIATWSVSSGLTLQNIVAALVDQAGFSAKLLRQRAATEKINVFTIRRKNDPFDPDLSADFVYRSGHDITCFDDFSAMLGKVYPFLKAAFRHEQRKRRSAAPLRKFEVEWRENPRMALLIEDGLLNCSSRDKRRKSNSRC